MHIGYIVGSSIAFMVTITGISYLVIARKRRKNSKWAVWAVVFGVCALISAFINYDLFKS